MKLNERWFDIKEYEGLYKISNLGNIEREGKKLKMCKSSEGYFNLFKQKKYKWKYIIRL